MYTTTYPNQKTEEPVNVLPWGLGALGLGGIGAALLAYQKRGKSRGRTQYPQGKLNLDTVAAKQQSLPINPLQVLNIDEVVEMARQNNDLQNIALSDISSIHPKSGTGRSYNEDGFQNPNYSLPSEKLDAFRREDTGTGTTPVESRRLGLDVTPLPLLLTQSGNNILLSNNGQKIFQGDPATVIEILRNEGRNISYQKTPEGYNIPTQELELERITWGEKGEYVVSDIAKRIELAQRIGLPVGALPNDRGMAELLASGGNWQLADTLKKEAALRALDGNTAEAQKLQAAAGQIYNLNQPSAFIKRSAAEYLASQIQDAAVANQIMGAIKNTDANLIPIHKSARKFIGQTLPNATGEQYLVSNNGLYDLDPYLKQVSPNDLFRYQSKGKDSGFVVQTLNDAAKKTLPFNLRTSTDFLDYTPDGIDFLIPKDSRPASKIVKRATTDSFKTVTSATPGEIMKSVATARPDLIRDAQYAPLGSTARSIEGVDISTANDGIVDLYTRLNTPVRAGNTKNWRNQFDSEISEIDPRSIESATSTDASRLEVFDDLDEIIAPKSRDGHRQSAYQLLQQERNELWNAGRSRINAAIDTELLADKALTNNWEAWRNARQQYDTATALAVPAVRQAQELKRAANKARAASPKRLQEMARIYMEQDGIANQYLRQQADALDNMILLNRENPLVPSLRGTAGDVDDLIKGAYNPSSTAIGRDEALSTKTKEQMDLILRGQPRLVTFTGATGTAGYQKLPVLDRQALIDSYS